MPIDDPVLVDNTTPYGPPPAPLSFELKLSQPVLSDHAQPESEEVAVLAFATGAERNVVAETKAAHAKIEAICKLRLNVVLNMTASVD